MTDLSEAVVAAIPTAAPSTAVQPMAELRECAAHGQYTALGTHHQRIGRVTWTGCQTCRGDEEAAAKAAADARKASDQAARVAETLKLANIPRRFAGKTFESFAATTPPQGDALALCRAFSDDFAGALQTGYSLILSGGPGTGKSHLAAAVMQSVMARGHAAQYLTCMDLIRAVRDTWRKDSPCTESEMLHVMGDVLDLLVIDEIGVQYGTDGEQNIVFDVLDRRYRQMRPSILISNSSRVQFRGYVGDRVYDRLRETAKWVPFAWASHRPRDISAEA